MMSLLLHISLFALNSWNIHSMCLLIERGRDNTMTQSVLILANMALSFEAYQIAKILI